MDRRQLLTSGAAGGTGMLLVRPVAAGSGSDVARRMRLQWRRDRDQARRDLPARTSETVELHDALSDGLGAFGVVKSLQTASEDTIRTPEV